MRIRKRALRLCGSANSPPAAPPLDAVVEVPPPPPPVAMHLEPCSALKSDAVVSLESLATTVGEPCKLNRSPWDLIADPYLSPQEEDELVDEYFVHVAWRASWLFTVNTSPASVKKQKKKKRPHMDVVSKKAPKKVVVNKKDQKNVHAKKNAQVKKEEVDERKPPRIKRKKHNGESWICDRPTIIHNSVGDYHLDREHSGSHFRSYINREVSLVMKDAVAASKPATSSRPQKKKPRHDFSVEGFYYYSGFGPCRSKSFFRRSSMNESIPTNEEEEEEEEPTEDDSLTKEEVHATPDDKNNLA